MVSLFKVKREKVWNLPTRVSAWKNVIKVRGSYSRPFEKLDIFWLLMEFDEVERFYMSTHFIWRMASTYGIHHAIQYLD